MQQSIIEYSRSSQISAYAKYLHIMTDAFCVSAKHTSAVPEKTAVAAVSAGSAETPEAESGRLTGTGV